MCGRKERQRKEAAQQAQPATKKSIVSWAVSFQCKSSKAKQHGRRKKKWNRNWIGSVVGWLLGHWIDRDRETVGWYIIFFLCCLFSSLDKITIITRHDDRHSSRAAGIEVTSIKEEVGGRGVDVENVRWRWWWWIDVGSNDQSTSVLSFVPSTRLWMHLDFQELRSRQGTTCPENPILRQHKG